MIRADYAITPRYHTMPPLPPYADVDDTPPLRRLRYAAAIR